MFTAGKINIPLGGSLQNAAWSPDGTRILFTRFRKGYNKGISDLFIYDFASKDIKSVFADGFNNVSQPGSTWNKSNVITFSSDRPADPDVSPEDNDTGVDQVWTFDLVYNNLLQVPGRKGFMDYEPSWDNVGNCIVYESHIVDMEANGVIYMSGAKMPRVQLTETGGDCRQPNWSPDGKWIVYQQRKRGRWDLWLFDVALKRHRILTDADLGGDSTDATFSPDSKYVLCSRERDDAAGLFALPVYGGPEVAIDPNGHGYSGAASWHANGWVVCEHTTVDDPEAGIGMGTSLYLIEVKNVAR